MMIRILLTEGEANLILDLAKTKSTPPQDSKVGHRIGDCMTADYWKHIAAQIESALTKGSQQ